MSTKAKDVKQQAQAAQSVATLEDNPMVVVGGAVPDYIKDSGKGLGNENVTAGDLVVPRIELVQALSPCLDEKNDAAYIPNAKQGMMFNSLTRKLYGGAVHVVPVSYAMQFLVWRDRKKGGGFRGSYGTREEAEKVIAEQEVPGDWEALETGQHLVLLATADGRIEEAMVSMSRTKLKISRQWNSLVRQAGGDRYGRAYELTGVQARNDKNEVYYNFNVRPVGYPSQKMYEAAGRFFQEMASGQTRVVMDVTDLDDSEAPERQQPAQGAQKGRTEF